MLRHFRAFKHRGFRLFFAGQLVSVIGSWMQNLAQGWLLWRMTHSEWMLGLLGFCQMGPVLVFGLAAGIVADRVDRYKLVLLTQSAALIQSVILAALTLGGVVEVWHLPVLAVALGTISAFDMTARQAFFIQMVGSEDLPNAIALNSALFNGARAIGPAIAGEVVERFGEGACFALNAFSFLAVLGCLLAMRLERRPPAPVKASAASQVREGLVYAWRDRGIRRVLLIVAGAAGFGMAYIPLVPAVAGQVLHLGARGLGTLLTMAGLGAIGGAFYMAGRQRTEGLTQLAGRSSALFGVSLAAFGMSREPLLSALLLIPAGFGMMTVLSSANTLIQHRAPEALRGRLVSLYIFTFGGLAPLGSLLLGAIAKSAGVRAAIVLGGALTLLSALASLSQKKTGNLFPAALS